MKLVIITLLFGTLAICHGNGYRLPRCPDKFINLLNGCYHFSSSQSTWSNASIHCQRMNAALYSVESIQESYAIKMYLFYNKDYKTDFYWTSGTDAHHEGHFRWMSTSQPFTYTDWCKGEPNNYGGKEHCVHLGSEDPTGYRWCWHDVHCDGETGNEIQMYYICEHRPL